MAFNLYNDEQLRQAMMANPQAFQMINTQAPSTPPKERNFLESLVGSFVDPVVGLGTKLGEGVSAASRGKLQDFMSGSEFYDPSLMSREDYATFRENPLLDTLKDVGGTAANFIPAGAFGKGLMGLAKAGAVSGALSGFANSKAKDWNELDPTSIATDALTGGAIGGGLGLLGKGFSKLTGAADNVATQAGEQAAQSGLAGKLNEFADGRDLNVFKRAVGTNAPAKIGGAQFEKEALDFAKKAGINVNNADDLANMSQQLFDQFGGQIQNAADNATQAGAKIDVNKLTQPLQEQLSKAVSADAKRPIQDVLEQITAAAPDGTLTPSQVYALKQEAGNFGKFNMNAADATKAKAWQDVYGSMSDELKNSLQGVGLNNYDDINKNLEMAIKSGKWADAAAQKVRPTATLNDMAQDVGAFTGIATGNPIMAIPGAVAGKVLQSPMAEKGLANLARGAANAVDGIGGAAGGLGKFAPKISPSLLAKAGGIAAGGDYSNLGGGNQADQPMSPDASQMQGLGNAQGLPMQNPQHLQLYSQLNNEIAKQLMLPPKQGGMGMDAAEALQKAPYYAQIQYGVDTSAAVPDELQPKVKGNGKSSKTESDKKFSAASDTAMQAYNLLSSGKANTGKLANLTNSVGEFFGNQSPSQTEYNSMLTAAASAARNALSGAAVSPSEEARMMALLPNINDEPNIAKQKLQSFAKAMQIYANQS